MSDDLKVLVRAPCSSLPRPTASSVETPVSMVRPEPVVSEGKGEASSSGDSFSSPEFELAIRWAGPTSDVSVGPSGAAADRQRMVMYDWSYRPPRCLGQQCVLQFG